MTETRNPLALEEQVCFALALAFRGVVAAYRPVLEPLGLTHPQYLVMLALWEQDKVGISNLSARLRLDPGTLSPLVKRLEQAGLLTRVRAPHDERLLEISLTDSGRELRQEALAIPGTMLSRFGMTQSDLERTNAMLHAIIEASQAIEAP